MAPKPPPPRPTTTDTRDPPPLLRVAGLVALVAVIAIDAESQHWNPDPWVYLVGVGLIVWGPRVVPSLVKRD